MTQLKSHFKSPIVRFFLILIAALFAGYLYLKFIHVAGRPVCCGDDFHQRQQDSGIPHAFSQFTTLTATVHISGSLLTPEDEVGKEKETKEKEDKIVKILIDKLNRKLLSVGRSDLAVEKYGQQITFQTSPFNLNIKLYMNNESYRSQDLRALYVVYIERAKIFSMYSEAQLKRADDPLYSLTVAERRDIINEGKHIGAYAKEFFTGTMDIGSPEMNDKLEKCADWAVSQLKFELDSANKLQEQYVSQERPPHGRD